MKKMQATYLVFKIHDKKKPSLHHDDDGLENVACHKEAEEGEAFLEAARGS